MVRIEIVSGEGTSEGTGELWTASINVPSIRGRLTRERHGGERWAYCRVNGARVSDNDIGDAILDAQESTSEADSGS